MTDKQDMLFDLIQYLKLSTVKQHFIAMAQQAQKDKLTYEQFLFLVLELEVQARKIKSTQRRIKMAKFPYCKTLDEFDFAMSNTISQVSINKLATNQYINNAEHIIFTGEPGTGKTHLAIALGYLATQHGKNVRFITLANLANNLIESKDDNALSKTIHKFTKADLLILDEFGYVPLTKFDAELIFQVISDRQEIRPIIITTNLPFSEWNNIIPEPRLCKAIIDRLTHKAHIIDTGVQSIRLEQTMTNNKQQKIIDYDKKVV